MAQPMLVTGSRLANRYLVDAMIASGGYATVYRITDLQDASTRALKEVVDPDTGIREQFMLEAQLLMTSRHPNIPRGYDHFEEAGRAYLVMDYIAGHDLEQRLAQTLSQRNGPIDEMLALRWLLQVCDALHVMHTQPVPVFHRDIKPANIKLNGHGVPILIDFGLAKLGLPGPTAQAAQGVTPGYAPPEQYLAQGRTDARSDIYGMGATLYTLVTGREPPEATNRLLAKSGNTGQPLVPARLINPALSAPTAHIIDRAMDVSPTLRHQTALELREELASALAMLEHGHAPALPGERTGPLSLMSSPISQRRATPLPPSASGAHRKRTLVLRSAKDGTIVQPWFDLGGPLVSRAGKAALVFAAIELYWGLLCAAALGGVIGTRGFTHFPSITALIGGVGWLAAVITLTTLVARTLDRPIARLGRLSTGRRWLQGSLLILIWVGMNGLALVSLGSVSPDAGLFGLGFLGLASILTGLLSAANVLA